jgi:hypothetical protein
MRRFAGKLAAAQKPPEILGGKFKFRKTMTTKISKKN